MAFNKLPNHMFLDIFEYLSDSDLLRIRLVCRKWADIVSDSAVLRRKHYMVVSDESGIFDDQHEFLQTFLHSPYNICTNILFEDVIFAESENMIRLWKKIGANIECLRITFASGCVEDDVIVDSYKDNWLTLLKNTPNLIELKMEFLINISDGVAYSEFNLVDGEYNFKRLKELEIDCTDPFLNIYLMQILTKSAERLTTTQIRAKRPLEFATLHFLIESQKFTLKELKFLGSDAKTYLPKYFAIDNLSLEAVNLGEKSIIDSDLLKLLENHKNLRELTCHVSSKANLQQYDICLSKLELEKLDLIIYFESENTNWPFPRNFVNLRSLILHTKCKNLNITLEIPTNWSRLEVLEIHNPKSLQLSSVLLQSIINNYSNLRVLSLHDLRCDSRLVAAICDKLVHLEQLHIRIHVTDPAIDRNAFRNISNLSKLNCLTVYDYIYICEDSFFIEHLRLPTLTKLYMPIHSDFPSNKEVTDRGISGLLDNCPLLEFLELQYLDGITNASLDEIGEKLIYLLNFEINGRCITKEKINEIGNILHSRTQLNFNTLKQRKDIILNAYPKINCYKW